MGICYQPSFSFFIYFFDKYFAVAHMLTAGFAGIGVLSATPFIEYLISCYGWRGALQIIAAIMAHICICGLLLRTPEPEEAKPINVELMKPTDTSLDDQAVASANSCFLFLKDVARDFDLSLFRNVRFIFQTVLNGFLEAGYTGTVVYIFPYAVSIGISDKNAPFLLLAFGIAITIVRLSPIGWIFDKKLASTSNVSGVAHLIMGLLIIATPFTRIYEVLMTFAVLFGALQGVGGCLLFVVVARSAGSRDKGPSAHAWFLLIHGIGSTVVVYLVGKLNASSMYDT